MRGAKSDMKFQHTAARRRLRHARPGRQSARRFQHTAARRRLPPEKQKALAVVRVSTHSRPKAAAGLDCLLTLTYRVSTHSRPKAAASPFCDRPCAGTSFNTQPPEGGCPSRPSC